MPPVDVDIVRANALDFTDINRLATALSAGEKARAAAYKVRGAGHLFTFARGLLRLELAKRLGGGPEGVIFDVRPSGKPDVRRQGADRLDWRFSVSHSGPHVALAFALGVDVGIDIEQVDRPVNPLEIARRYFTPLEFETLEATPPDARHRAFFSGWTRKEAIVKARGLTMAESLSTLSVDLDPTVAHPGYEDLGGNAPRAFCQLTAFEFPDLALIGAVAIRSERRPRLRVFVLSGPRFD